MDFAVLEFMPDAVVVTDADGVIQFINRAGEALFGYDRVEILGRPIEILLPSRFRAAHRLERETYFAAPRTRPMGLGLELRGLARDGHEIPVEISLASLAGENATVAAIRDVSERKELEERARQAEKAEAEIRHRDEVLAIASHELRGPVGLVQLQLAVLQRSAVETMDDFGAMQERMGKIERNTRHLARLIEDLLDTSSHGGTLALKVEEADLAALARVALGDLREWVERTGSQLTLHAEAPVSGRWDPLRIDQVIANLVANAAKYGEGKPIEVRVDGDPERARLTVIDHGSGIDVADHERIFERFERAVSPGAARGLGLGLYIARQIVEAHGGRILVHSSPGSGSRFTVELPRLTHAA
jgi:two-component system, LuxR family, sensor kinase FixL